MLPAQERIDILSKRIDNLNKGSGDYDIGNRVRAIRTAKSSLDAAEVEACQK